MKKIFLLMLISINVQANTIDLLLRARGLQAVDRLEQLQKKNGNSQGKKLSKKELCEFGFETMYFSFAHPDLIKVVKKSVYKELSKNAMAYIMIIFDESNKMGFQMNYIYKEPTDKTPLLSEISTIKDGWRTKVVHTIPNVIYVTTDKCMYAFDLTDPLKTSVDAI